MITDLTRRGLLTLSFIGGNGINNIRQNRRNILRNIILMIKIILHLVRIKAIFDITICRFCIIRYLASCGSCIHHNVPTNHSIRHRMLIMDHNIAYGLRALGIIHHIPRQKRIILGLGRCPSNGILALYCFRTRNIKTTPDRMVI